MTHAKLTALVIIALLSTSVVVAQSTLAKRVAWNLCYDEAGNRWLRSGRFYGTVEVRFDPSCPQRVIDGTMALVPRVNELLGTGAHLSTTLHSDSTLTVYYGEASRRRFNAASGFTIPDNAMGYNGVNGHDGHLMRSFVWLRSDYDASTLVQEFTQSLGACSDWPDAPKNALWRDESTALWLAPEEQFALRLLYNILRGGETHTQVEQVADSVLLFMGP